MGKIMFFVEVKQKDADVFYIKSRPFFIGGFLLLYGERRFHVLYSVKLENLFKSCLSTRYGVLVKNEDVLHVFVPACNYLGARLGF